MMPMAPVAVIITGPDAQRAVDCANPGANRAADNRAHRARRAAASVSALFRPADQSLRLSHHRERKRGAQTGGKD